MLFRSERIVTRYFGGEPWVLRDVPVRSIDRKVTAAVVDRGL